MSELVELKGVVEHITFANAQNGFTVLSLSDGAVLHTCVGIMLDIHPGEELLLRGRRDFHQSYGEQFKVETYERCMPSTAAAILHYLSGGAIKGVGKATARLIVERFGEDTLEIIEKSPLRLSEIKGITLKKAQAIGEEYMRQFGIREIMIFLTRFQITAETAQMVYKTLGNSAIERIEENPFVLCDGAIGIGFERADQIRAQIGLSNDDYERISAGIIYVLRHNLGNGHTCLPREKLAATASGLLQLMPRETEAVLKDMLDKKQVIAEQFGETEYLLLPEMHTAESYIAARLELMLRRPPVVSNITPEDISNIEQVEGIEYETKQKQAIFDAMNIGLLILTGGPGTGKTTTLNAMIKLMEREDLNILLAAPTGRAAKRMTELTGYEAKTLHRMLEAAWDISGKLQFSRNEQHPLKADVIIIDELSMVDAQLFESLLRATPLGCRLVLVGDADQLPSVGAGNVLSDLIASGKLPSVRLTEVFRQALESLIVRNAHEIMQGRAPVLDVRDSDFFLLKAQSAQAAARLVLELVTERLPAAYGYNPETDIQVLCPSKKRELGTANLNNLLQQQLNPEAPDKKQIGRPSFILRQGDKVMQSKNDYDIEWVRDDGTAGRGVFNGDVGLLLDISRATATLTVRYDDRVATYIGDQYENLEPAYAMTIHKSQGSEFECVVLPILDTPPQLLYRNLLYTAVTRAKKLLVLVGSDRVIVSMAANNKRTLRYTALRRFLQQDS